MKILYVAHRIPYPPNKGEKIRSFHQIRHLSQKHTVHLICFIDDPEDWQYVKKLREYCASVDVVYRKKTVATLLATLALFTKKPLSVASFYSVALAKKIGLRLRFETFDRILVCSSALAGYVQHVCDIPKVMDFIDVDSEKWRLYADHHLFPLSWIYRLEANRLARHEEQVVKVFDHAVFISSEETRLFQRRVSNRPISVISNGVDVNYFVPNDNTPACFSQPVVVFTGAMDYFPNIDAVTYFCEKIFPLVRVAVPEAQFCIVGRNPTRQVRKLSRQPNVVVTGAVTDVRPYLMKAAVAVAPLRLARGLQNKILEAMAMGLPVVGTSQAFQGVQATEQDGIRRADDPQKFAMDVLTFLRGDPRLRLRSSLHALRYVKDHHQWQNHGAELEDLLQKMIAAPQTKNQLALARASGI